MIHARKITVWCESDLADDADIAAALEEGRLWEVCSGVQYSITPDPECTATCEERHE